MTTLEKRPLEIRLYTMDFSLLPEIVGGDTITSAAAPVVTTSSQGAVAGDLTITSVAIAGSPPTAVKCQISGGVAGSDYEITFRVGTANGYTLQAVGYLQIVGN